MLLEKLKTKAIKAPLIYRPSFNILREICTRNKTLENEKAGILRTSVRATGQSQKICRSTAHRPYETSTFAICRRLFKCCKMFGKVRTKLELGCFKIKTYFSHTALAFHRLSSFIKSLQKTTTTLFISAYSRCNSPFKNWNIFPSIGTESNVNLRKGWKCLKQTKPRVTHNSKNSETERHWIPWHATLRGLLKPILVKWCAAFAAHLFGYSKIIEEWFISSYLAVSLASLEASSGTAAVTDLFSNI